MTDFTRKGEFLAGVRATLPMIIGAIPFGIIFGAVAINNGLSPLATLGMSIFVFAGSSQFIAVSLVGQGAGIAVIVLTTLVVNLRHALYSASLAPYLRHLSQKWLLPLGFWLTDETYAAVIGRYQKPDGSPYQHWYQLGSSLAMYLNWQVCTLIGVIAGQQITDAQSWGLDFAMVVTFIGIVVPLLITRPMLMCAVAAGITAVLAQPLPHNLGLIVAALVGIGAGMLTETLTAAPTQEATSS